jgi:hypothetical protein
MPAAKLESDSDSAHSIYYTKGEINGRKIETLEWGNAHYRKDDAGKWISSEGQDPDLKELYSRLSWLFPGPVSALDSEDGNVLNAQTSETVNGILVQHFIWGTTSRMGGFGPFEVWVDPATRYMHRIRFWCSLSDGAATPRATNDTKPSTTAVGIAGSEGQSVCLSMTMSRHNEPFDFAERTGAQMPK